jgi:recombination protein RecT
MANLKPAGTLAPAKPQQGFAALLQSQWPRIEAVMPRHMTPDRLFQMAVSAYNTTPKLADCTPISLLSCIMKCAALGIEPSNVDGLGRAYILPFFNNKTKKHEATFILGYKGAIDLARRSGEIESITAHAVYDGDTFRYTMGDDESIVHEPALDVVHEPDAIIYVYMIARFKGGGVHRQVMTKAEVDSVRRQSKSPNNGPWVTHYEQMALKTVINRAKPYLPLSTEVRQAMSDDDGAGNGFREVLEPPLIEPIDITAALPPVPFDDGTQAPDAPDATAPAEVTAEAVETPASPMADKDIEF